MRFNCTCPIIQTASTANYSTSPILLILVLFITLIVTETYADKVDECCRAHNIPDVCVQTLCYPLRPPGDFDVYDIFHKKNNCSKHLPEVRIFFLNQKICLDRTMFGRRS